MIHIIPETDIAMSSSEKQGGIQAIIFLKINKTVTTFVQIESV
jgi:hypothetical protein